MALALVLALAAALLVTAPPPAAAAEQTVSGVVESGGTPLEGYAVDLLRTEPAAVPTVVGTAVTDASGTFSIDHDPGGGTEGTYYVLARSAATTPTPDAVVLSAVLGATPPTTVTVNPRTTVATAYAMAQFLDAGVISGSPLGIGNAASMSFNVADPVTGGIGAVLDGAPNGIETSARATFNSLANLVAACVESAVDCEAFRAAATPTGGTQPADSLQALRNLVVQPAHNVLDVYALTRAGSTPYGPSRDEPPAAWTLALRFAGDGRTLNGPGNFALDHEGNMWVAVNYTYAPPGEVACASNLLARFAPAGSYVAGSPYAGGGLSGAGYGIDIDRYGDVWVSNFGFAAAECADQPPHDTLSRFSMTGDALSPPEGYQVDGVDWPQGMEFDAQGNLWVANCAGDSVTFLPDGDPTRARTLDGLGVTKPFDVAFGSDGNTYVTGTESDNVAVVAPDGTLVRTIEGFHRPMGISADAQGRLWVANSGLVDLPCPTKDIDAVPPPSLGHIDPSTGEVTTFSGGGLTIPWGTSIDGHGNIWVSNFGGARLSGFCGLDDSPHCPEGVGKGGALSPPITGFAFDGLRRATATHADSAGNLWVTNNWKELPLEVNPGGYQVVVFLGIAGPLEAPAPEPEPVDPPTPAPTSPAPTAVPVAPRFTG